MKDSHPEHQTLSPPLPLPSQIEGGDRKARLLFRLTADLGVKYGLENSYKFLEKTLLCNRFLVGFRLASKTKDLYTPTLDLCRQIDMPPSFFDAFEKHIGEANIALFGFEESENTCLYKAYLEFGGNFKRIVGGNLEPFQIHMGFKWDAFDNRKGAVANYICYPLLSIDSIVSRLDKFYGKDQEKAFLIVKQLIERAASRMRGNEFLYAEVQEDGNRRDSFDINLYRANIRLHELHDILLQICEYYFIPAEAFNVSYNRVKDQIFGHVSGGVDRIGRDFLTVYFGVFGSSS